MSKQKTLDELVVKEEKLNGEERKELAECEVQANGTNGVLIHKRINSIMNDMPAIGKDEDNTAQHYKYRSIDAVLNVLHALLKKHHVFFTPHVVGKDRQILDRLDRQSGSKIGSTVLVALDVEYILYCSDDMSSLKVGPFIGEAMDAGDKASAKAMTMALKIMLSQVFCIPFQNGFDTDNEQPEEPRSRKLIDEQ